MAPPGADGPCPPVRASGTYDHWTVASVTPLANTLQLTGTRSYPAAIVPHMGETGCVQDNVAASTEEDVWISKDGKSLVSVDKPNGWTWTYTPTGLR